MSVEIILIDGEHHAHHLARGLLRLFVIFLEGIFQMAEIALHPQGRGYKLHRGNDLVRGNSLEHLNVLVNLLGWFAGCCWRRRLGAEKGWSEHDQQSDETPCRSYSREPHTAPHNCRFSFRQARSVALKLCPIQSQGDNLAPRNRVHKDGRKRGREMRCGCCSCRRYSPSQPEKPRLR